MTWTQTTRGRLLAGLVLALAAIAMAEVPWRSGPSVPHGRYAFGVVRHGSDIYAVGGFAAGYELHVLYSGADSWTALAPLPEAQPGATAAVVGDKIYSFGAYPGSDLCQIYDIDTDTWSAGPSMPASLYWATSQTVGTSIYVIGGYTPGSGSRDSVYILDTTAGTWTQGASLPAPMQIPASAVHGQSIYVFDDYSRLGDLAYVKYDVTAGTWSTFTGPPSGHGDASVAVDVGDFIYLGGGSPGNIYTAYDTVEVYDPAADAWLPGPSLNEARYQSGAVYLPSEDAIYVVAGRDSSANRMTSVEILPASFVDLVASSETADHGVVTGSYVLTQAADDVCEQIQEVVVSRKSSLSHEWLIDDVPATGTRTLYVKAYCTASSDGDVFPFQVRVGRRWVDALTVTKTADDDLWQSFVLPDGISGTVRIRVVDSDNSKNATAVDAVFVDHLFIRSQ